MTVKSFHPISAIVYFASVLAISMFSQNPLLHIISLIGAMAYYVKMNKNGYIKELLVYLAMLCIVAAINPFFSHRGETVLFFMNKNPITLESLLYGFGIAMMLISVIYWFKCFSLIMTEDKLLCLFGGISPKLALLISSSLRFVPHFKQRIKKIKNAQKTMGMYSSDAFSDRISGTMRSYSSLVGWSLENAIDVGTSMKSRGYGLKGRTHFSLFKFSVGDTVAVGIIAFLDFIVMYFMFIGKLDFVYYPRMSAMNISASGICALVAFAMLCFLPFILELKEDLQWKYYRSKI